MRDGRSQERCSGQENCMCQGLGWGKKELPGAVKALHSGASVKESQLMLKAPGSPGGIGTGEKWGPACDFPSSL